MKNKIPIILNERGLSISDLHQMMAQAGQRFSYNALLELAKPSAGSIADGVKIGTLRKISISLDVPISDLFGEDKDDKKA